jgi:predicted glycosyltransferase
MVSQKGALYNDDSRNRGDESFSDKSQGSKTTNASSLATAVSGSSNGEGMELVAGRFHARTQARKYNDRWVIYTGPRTSKREKEALVKPGFYVAVYIKGVSRRSASYKTLL